MALQSMTWHIVPDCGLTLTNCNLQPSSDLDPTDYHDLREYEINNISISNRSFNDYDINQQQLRDSAMIENTINGAIQQQRESAENGTWKGSMTQNLSCRSSDARVELTLKSRTIVLA